MSLDDGLNVLLNQIEDFIKEWREEMIVEYEKGEKD